MRKLPCKIFDPISLGEGAGVGHPKGDQTMAIPEGLTLFDLVESGISNTHASVGVVVRLRQELSLVKDMPVLIAIDQVRNFSSPLKNFTCVLLRYSVTCAFNLT